MDFGPAKPLRIDAIPVATDRSLVARYAAATRVADGAIPTTFPIVWLSHPLIRSAIESFAKAGEVAFHEEQRFDYASPLRLDASYEMSVEVSRRDMPARIAIDGTVDEAGTAILSMHTLLRLVTSDGESVSRQAMSAQQQ